MSEQEDPNGDPRKIRVPIRLLSRLFDLASSAERYLPAALEGKPGKLLRQLAIDLNDIETEYEGYIGQDNADGYGMMATDLIEQTWESASLDDEEIVLTPGKE